MYYFWIALIIDKYQPLFILLKGKIVYSPGSNPQSFSFLGSIQH